MKPQSSWPGMLVIGLLASWPAEALASDRPPEATPELAAAGRGKVAVAFVLSDGAVMIDFGGPWEVFENVHIPSRGPDMSDQMPFRLYTVSDARTVVRISGGMQVVPDYTFEDAPAANVVVVPAQGGASHKMLEWLRARARKSDVVMSVCNGAFKLAAAGLLKGKQATAQHAAYRRFQEEYPDVLLQKGMRYVRADKVVFTAGGLSSGIDLALHVVELYFGRSVAARTARYMEYEGQGWMGDGSASMSFTDK
jgi:transcriptional regulator GlxA family with amidase domain